MTFRNQRTAHRFPVGTLLASIALFLVLYGVVANIAEASRALAASREYLAHSRNGDVARIDSYDPTVARPRQSGPRCVAHEQPRECIDRGR